jgi:hypothetical protein
VRLLSFYAILYRFAHANSLNVCTTDSAEVSFQFYQYSICSSYGLPGNLTVCFIADCRATLIPVVRIESGMFRLWQPLLWPQMSVARPFCRRPAHTARAVLFITLLVLAGDVNRTRAQVQMSTQTTGLSLVVLTVSLCPEKSL